MLNGSELRAQTATRFAEKVTSFLPSYGHIGQLVILYNMLTTALGSYRGHVQNYSAVSRL